ncbi:Heat shock protein Hsp90 [Phytophthora palmivora]|uniref:Heat shock protein Hsp90 n=1 Tax=Phytophthora palmivora TaxID=4796 RepID=A0A2P4XJ25_9STRA|nr:Heat shock protein Hsp90 [Phytophthora palmivora]
MSPMDTAGEERLRQARACIRKTFGPGGSGRRTKRTLEMAGEAPTPAKTPRTKLRQRIAKASQLSTEHLFFQEFGSSEELMKEEFDLARPAGYPSNQYAARDAAGDFRLSIHQRSTGTIIDKCESIDATHTYPNAAKGG